MSIVHRTLAFLLLALLLAAGCGQTEQETAREEPPVADPVTTEQVVESEPAQEPADELLDWSNYEEGVAKARDEGRFLLIDFWTTWCHWCKVMDKETYADAAVLARLEESFVAVKVNAESKQPQGGEGAMNGEAIARAYGVSSYPTTWFVDPEGNKIAPLAGYMPAAEFLVVLDFISSSSYKSMNFQSYRDSLAEG